MKKVLVGGPLLGTRVPAGTKTAPNDDDDGNIVSSWKTLKPILTDPMMGNTSNAQQQQRFVLLPNSQFISVLAYKTGTRIGTLVVQKQKYCNDDTTTNQPSEIVATTDDHNDADDHPMLPKDHGRDDIRILCTALATFPSTSTNGMASDSSNNNALWSILASSEKNNGNMNATEATATTINMSLSDHVLLVGCSDGTVQEFDLGRLLMTSDDTYNATTTDSDDTSLELLGPIFKPRRIFRVADASNDISIQLLCVVGQNNKNSVLKDAIVVYALTTMTDKENRKPIVRSVGDIINEEETESSRNDNSKGTYGDDKVNGNLVRFVISSMPLEKKGGRSQVPITLDFGNHPMTVMDDKLKFINSYFSTTKTMPEKKKQQQHDQGPNYMPFQLLATNVTISDNSKTMEAAIVLASATKLSVYYDTIDVVTINRINNSNSKLMNQIQLISLQSSSPSFRHPVNFYIKTVYDRHELLTSIAIAPNREDIACGHITGKVRILINAISSCIQYSKDIEQYNQLMDQRQHVKNYKNDIMDDVEDYNGKLDDIKIDPRQPNHPSNFGSPGGILVRKLHWHAHPVMSLQYDYNIPTQMNEGMLYSGGDESVLVTWQLSQGTYKPTDFLPRIAVGGIVHLLCSKSHASSNTSSSSGDEMILVFCSDNSLQLFDSCNKNVKWKVQGLASGRIPTIGPRYNRIMKMATSGGPTTKHQQPMLVLSGLPKAPGCIHWYDPTEQNVVQSLEVVPFNRVSRTEPDESQMPYPTVTHTAWSTRCHDKDLITIDVVPTENSSIGRQDTLPDGKLYGNTTTIRFWMMPSSSRTYCQVASMTYPHGRKNRISAVAISPNGIFAVTVSNDEKAFRLWQKYRKVDTDTLADDDDNYSDGGLERTSRANKNPEWFCRCKVSTPSAFSNFVTGASAVSFSRDSTVVAIGFGSTITMWDFNTVTLLTCHRHGNELPYSLVDQVQFLDTNELPDSLLSKSASSVVLQSSYGEFGPDGFGWIWELPYDEKVVRISHVEFIPSHNVVAIALYDSERDVSCVTLVNGLSGTPCKELLTPRGILEDIPGEILALSASETYAAAKKRTNGENGATQSTTVQSIRLYVLTDSGHMIASLNENDIADEMQRLKTSATIGTDQFELPAVPLLAAVAKQSALLQNSNKRALSVIGVSDLEGGPTNKKMSLLNFGTIIGEDGQSSKLPSTELPRLEGEFARFFLARNLQRRATSS